MNHLSAFGGSLHLAHYAKRAGVDGRTTMAVRSESSQTARHKLPHWRGLVQPIAARLKRRRRHCDACIPKVRRAHGLRVIEAARKALAVQAAEGNDPRASNRAGRKRGEAISEQHRRNRAWARGANADRDAAWFLSEIVPKLDAYSLSQIAKATGLSLAACSRIRAGTRVPHPRHWELLESLTAR
jgi:hypothetical protein